MIAPDAVQSHDKSHPGSVMSAARPVRSRHTGASTVATCVMAGSASDLGDDGAEIIASDGATRWAALASADL